MAQPFVSHPSFSFHYALSYDDYHNYYTLEITNRDLRVVDDIKWLCLNNSNLQKPSGRQVPTAPNLDTFMRHTRTRAD